ncbi:hypothetical protein LARV_01418 [Longilinea arvoryzae]|uniref:Uncharacterized protein n=2 Tax=Longilinea arvoryzae TaxID=360412 RepID=A0A0S7B861_9CHLR|nr:hypothetical protein LARV_01418 [Longilinea arvoryzae]
MHFHQVPRSEDLELDDRLVNITDRILSGEMTTQTETNSIEMENLRKMVLLIQAAVKPERPDAAMAARIKDRLQMEWKVARNRQPGAWRRPQYAISIALVVLLLVGLVGWGIPTAVDLPGAASDFMPWVSFLGALSIILIAILVWTDRRR